MNRKEVKKEVAAVLDHMMPDELTDIKAEAVMQIFDQNTPRFDIDFFEFAFLVEACIPQRPIARTMFWHDVINKYYWVLTEGERADLYEWINRNPCYQKGLEDKQEDVLWFEYRYNPDNQYEVEAEADGKKETHRCFKFGDDPTYYISGCQSRRISLQERFITSVKKLPSVR